MYPFASRKSLLALIVLSAPFVVIVSMAHSGKAMVSSDCDSAAARWVEMMPQGAQETLGGKSMQAVLQDTERRYWIVVASWVGAAMVLETGHEQGDTGDKHIANLVITGDTLRKCWRSDTANWTPDERALLSQFDEVYTPERLAGVLGLAEEIVKGGN